VQKILHILQAIIKNYSEFNQQHNRQTNGIAVGAPMSPILAEAYIYIYKHGTKQIYLVLTEQQTFVFFRYVSDVLIIYDQNETNIKHAQRIQQTTTIYTIHYRKGTTRIY
jgi:hypothetical protein